MLLRSEQLLKDISNVIVEDVLSCWQWRISAMNAIVAITCWGDIFFTGDENGVYWLQTDWGALTKVADSIEQFQQHLNDEEKVDEWFLPLLVEKLLAAGKVLEDNEVYSFKKLPVIGGEYSVDNIEPVEMSVHFAVTGQLYDQIKDLPDGTKVDVRFER